MPETKIDWPKLLDEALTAPGNMGNVYSRFHDYSITNMMLFMLQGIHEPVASYSRWKSLGRQVVKGAKAKEVIVPVLVNDPRDAQRAMSKRAGKSAERSGGDGCLGTWAPPWAQTGCARLRGCPRADSIMRPPTTDEADGIFAKQPHLEPRCGRLVKTAPDFPRVAQRVVSQQ